METFNAMSGANIKLDLADFLRKLGLRHAEFAAFMYVFSVDYGTRKTYNIIENNER